MGATGPKRVVREPGEATRKVRFGPFELGGDFVVIAGPCALESPEQVERAAQAVKASGAHALRGGAFKPRTSPYSFQGLGEPGLRLLSEAGRRHRMPIVSEVLDVTQIPTMLEYVDVLQVGARNMQNFALLRALSKIDRPVLLKRGFGATIEEWMLAAEYLLDGGNEQVVLCERGIRSFDTTLRNTLDLAGMAWVKQRVKVPVIVDPSHSTGLATLVTPMALAAAVAGADGLLVEVHPAPEQALCDGAQALTPDAFEALMKGLAGVLAATGRRLAEVRPLSAVGGTR
ncbi:MAG: 3-deoxy-7-phosphoheptulonate synthase [Myxococcaceae bacterium]|nr:3-deoxy-7-phosphoheptulonate synthase [Myxococcaceae bacterium]